MRAAKRLYVHARLDHDDRARLDQLTSITGETESALVKQGLRLVQEREVGKGRPPTALELAEGLGLVGKYRGPADLSTSKKQLDGFGR